MEKIVAEFSLWYFPLCLLVGVGYAALLYFRETKSELSFNLRWLLAILRTLVITIIAVLLLNPLIRSLEKHSEKPVILVLQDNSGSLTMGKDSSYYQITYHGLISDFVNALPAEFDVQPFTFGGELSDGLDIDYSAVQTNTGKAFGEVYDRYSHKNVGAMVLLSDGINNRGANPLYSNFNFNFPIYTVALGDTSQQQDLILRKVNFNRIAYLDNQFPVEISVIAKKCNGQTTRLTIERNNETLFQTTLSFNSENDFKSVKTTLKARETGIQKYTVKLSPIEGEISLENNSFDLFIDVLEDKQKILLLADAPHPDISAIKQAVGDNVNYELDDFIIGDFDGSVKEYNLVILHGLPSVRNNSTALLRTLVEENIPSLFVLTKRTFLPLFNEQNAGLGLEPGNLFYNEALPYLNGDFSMFGLRERTREAIPLFPPLVSPYGSIQLSPSAVPLLFQQIGNVATGQPLWVFNQSYNRKTAVVLGTGIWKWRIKEYSITSSHDAFNDIINRTIQFLALKVDKSLFRVYGENSFTEQDEITFEAELYNEVYELINDPEISISVSGSDGSSYPFAFTRTSNAYYLNAGNLPADNYSYSAQVISGGVTLTEKGEFTVSASKLEQLNTEADHGFLFNLAQNYGGEMFYPEQLDELVEKINTRDDIKTITYTQKRFTEVLNNPYLLALILLLLSAEWFIRKRAGGY